MIRLPDAIIAASHPFCDERHVTRFNPPRWSQAWRHVATTTVPVVLCTAVLLSVWARFGAGAQQADRAGAEAQARRAAERIQALQREAERLASDERTLLNDLRRLEVERQIKVEELKRSNEEADRTRSELATTTERINELQRQEEAQRPDLRARLVEIYKLGRARYLRLLLSTSDVRQFGQAVRMVAALARVDRERVAAHQQTLGSLKIARADLETRSRDAEARRLDAERAAGAAAGAARAKANLVSDIDRRRDLNAQLAGELQVAQQKLQLTLRNLGGGSSNTDTSILPLRPFQGSLEWPAAGSVRRPAGNPLSTPGSGAGAIEIVAAEGTSVHAVHEGIVAYADVFTGFGNLVIVDHGAKTFSLYGDLQEMLVKRDARIDRGQVIGRVGLTPAGAAGLYFELRVDGRPVDPLQWLRKR